MKKISHKIPFRRTLAIICAATIAMLQCAVLLTVEPVHGADQIEISVKYTDGKTVSGTATLSNSSRHTIKYTYTDPDDGAVEKSAYVYGTTVNQMLSSAGIDSNKIKTVDIDGLGDITPDEFGSIMLLDHIDDSTEHPGLENSDVENKLSSSNPDNVGALISSSGKLTIDYNKKTIEKVEVANPSTAVKVGEKKQLNAKVTYDSFYEKHGQNKPKVKWKITKYTDRATISEDGLLTPKKDGAVTVVATAGSVPSTPKSITINKKDTPKPKKINIGTDKKVTISVSDAELKNGKAYPKVVVKYNGNTLSKPKDYNIMGYENNTKEGTGIVIIEGKGENYEGTRRVSFTIKPASTTSKKLSDHKYDLKERIKIEKGDKKDKVHKKMSLKVDGKLIDSDNWEVTDVEYRNGRAYIKFEVDGYTGTSSESIELSSTSSGSRSYTGRTGSNFRINRPSNASSSPSTGTTVPNVTYAPDRTITVKEVYLGEKIEDEPQTDPMDGTMTEPMDGTESTDYSDAMDVETPPLQFGPAAGSAAVAAAAAGAGAVGRIRRFKLDTATEAVEQVTNSEE